MITGVRAAVDVRGSASAADMPGADAPPNHVLLNEYQPGQGIDAHRDGPLYAPRVAIETTAGTMEFELWDDVAPKTVANFVKLASEGFYNGTVFHRTIPGFMIQGGCPDGTGMGGPGWNVDAEFNDTPHTRGVLSMARAQDPNSAGSQFFVCHGDANFLDGQYTAFGRLVSGEDTLDAIANAPTKPGGEGSSPVEPVKIESAEVTTTEA